MRVSDSDTGLLRYLYTQNPFYLIGTGLALYGVRIVASTESSLLADPIVLAGMLGAMMVLMALLTFVLIKAGNVWDDARTIMLSMLLVIVGMVTGCDSQVVLRPWTAVAVLGGAFTITVVLIESLIRGIGIRVSAHVRVPLYGLLGAIFFFALVFSSEFQIPLVSDLSSSGKIYLFAWVVAGMMLLCLPAIWAGRAVAEPNGTPWAWPFFPWSVFVVLIAAACLRLYLLSLAFYPGEGWSNPLALHFFMPIGLATMILICEAVHRQSKHAHDDCGFGFFAILVGLMAIVWQGDELKHEFASEVANSLASPLFLALTIVSAYGVILWLRRPYQTPVSQVLVLVVLAFTGPGDLLPGLAIRSVVPVFLIAAYCGMSAWLHDSTLRWIAACIPLLLAETLWLGQNYQWVIVAIQAVALCQLLALGIAFSRSDSNALRLRIGTMISTGLLILLAGGAAITSELMTLQLLGVCLLLQASLMVAGVMSRWRPAWIIAAYYSILTLVSVVAQCGMLSDGETRRGLAWIGSATVCFIAGLAISSYKAGWLDGCASHVRGLIAQIRLDFKRAQSVAASTNE